MDQKIICLAYPEILRTKFSSDLFSCRLFLVISSLERALPGNAITVQQLPDPRKPGYRIIEQWKRYGNGHPLWTFMMIESISEIQNIGRT